MNIQPPQHRPVVFDLDGTLVDSRKDIATATNHALVSHGFPALPEREIAGYVGDGALCLLRRASKLADGAPALRGLLDTFLDFYTAHAADFTTPAHGAQRALSMLGSPLALCTNKPRQTTIALLRALGWSHRFDAIVAGGDLPVQKPDPEPLLHIAAAFAVSPERLVMVGDGPQDIECGHAVGCYTVGVPGGMIPEDRLVAAKPHMVLRSLEELPALVSALD